MATINLDAVIAALTVKALTKSTVAKQEAWLAKQLDKLERKLAKFEVKAEAGKKAVVKVAGIEVAFNAKGNVDPGVTFEYDGADYDLADSNTALAADLIEAGTPGEPGGEPGEGDTFTLTAAMDNLTGTDDNDTFNANVVAGASAVADSETLTSLDVLDGGEGTDTLIYVTVGPSALPAATISNIEVIDIISDGGVTADVSGANITGVTTLTAKAAAGAVDIDAKSNLTSVTVTGTATTVAIDDAGTAATTADKLTTVSVSGNTGALTIGATEAVDSLTSLTLANSSQNATVTATAGTRALSLSVNKLTGGTIQDATATTLNVTTTGAASTGVTLSAAAATAVTIAADEKLTGTLTIGAAKSLTVTGDSLVTVSAATLTALETVDASASTGGLDSKAVAFGDAVTFTGGAGADSIQVGATTKAITTGAGNDRVLITDNIAALGTGGSIDAGEGTDTIAVSADEATTISGAGTFDASISNFEEVELAVAGSAGVTVDLSDFDDASKFKASVDVNQTIAITNMATGGTVAYTAAQAAVTTVSVTNAASGTADSLNISLAGAAAVANAGITAADVETLAIATSDTDADTTDADIAFTITTLTAAAAKSVTVTGDAGLTLGTFSATTVTSFDASGMTTKASDGGVSWTTGALAAAATITGSGGDDTFVVSAATKAVAVTAGAGDDTITANNAQANVINAGDGDDTVTMGSGAVTVDLGAGADTLIVAAAATQTSSVTLGAGIDTVEIQAVQASAGAYLSLKDFAVGDKIDVSGVINGTIAGATLGSKVTLGGAATFANYIDAIAAGDGNTANSIDGWFQLGGNTYLVIDNSAAATFQDGADIVIEITGTVDLTNSTQAAGVYTLV